jgi:5-methylcytosine-specific restriction endonuclease McrA
MVELAQILIDIEDHLFTTKNLRFQDRALYYHLLRHTHAVGRDTVLVAMAPLGVAIGGHEGTARHSIRALEREGCVLIERSNRGHSVRLFLPSEIPGVVPSTRPPDELDLNSLDFFEGRHHIAALHDRENGACFYCLCQIAIERATLDHVIPRVEHGDNSFRNIVVTCHDCNARKQGAGAGDFLRSLYRRQVLSAGELEERHAALGALQAGRLVRRLELLRLRA